MMTRALFVVTIVVVALAGTYAITDEAFSTTYNEKIAKSLFGFNAASMAADPSACLTNVADPADEWQLIVRSEVQCARGANNTCVFMVLRSDPNEQFMVVFRGSVGDVQLLTEALSLPQKPLDKFGKVQSYFLSAFGYLWPQVQNALNDPEHESYSLVVTGYSLGGSLASLTALKTIADGHRSADKVYLLTFGQPRVGDRQLGQNIDKYVKYSHRVVNRADLIPHYPPFVPLFSGRKLLKGSYYHNQQEIWYQDGMADGATYTTTTKNEDPAGSDSMRGKFKLADHKLYFNRDFATYASHDCKDA